MRSTGTVERMGSKPGEPRSLADDLRARTDDELAALLRARPDLSAPVPVDISQLASRAATRASVVRALDRLDRFTLQVVDALLLQPGPAGVADVQSLLGAAADDVAAALTTLRAQALTWGTQAAHQLVRVVHEIVGPNPAGLGPPAAQTLRAMSPRRSAAVAANLGLPTNGDHAANAAAITEHLTDQATVAALVADLSEPAQAALRTLAAGPPTGRVDNAARDIDGDARTPVDELLSHGLIVPVDDESVTLPREIALAVRGGAIHPNSRYTAPEPVTEQRDAQLVDRTAGAAAFDIVRKIESLLSEWSEHPPPVLRTGGLGVRELRRLPGLLNTDTADAALIADLAFAAGLVAPSSDVDQVWLPTPAYDAWLRDDVSERWASLAHTWLTTSRVAGLVGSRDDRDRPIQALGGELDRPLAAETRKITLASLADLPPGSTATSDSVLDVVRWKRPRRGGRLRDDLVRWTLRESELLGVTAMGALASFARPLLDGRTSDKAVAAATEAVQASLPEPLGHILVQADLTAIAPGPLRSDLARDLHLLSDVESRGGASVHRFTADSLRRALDHGWTTTNIHEFLAGVSRTPVPQPLAYLVDDVGRKHGQIRVGAAASFVRCDDPSTLAEIVSRPQASSLGLRRLAPTVLVSSEDGHTLLDQLRAMGFAPSAEAADGSVVVARPEARRAPERPAPQPLLTDRPAPDETLLGATVRAVRAGERAAANRPDRARTDRPRESDAASTLVELRNAIADGSTLWIDYLDHHGIANELVVDPVRLEGGWLTAFDHRHSEVRSFAVHRISGVAAMTAT